MPVTSEKGLQQLTRGEAMALLASVPVGRVVFTSQALPAIRPVNHLIEDERIVIGLTAGSAIVESARAGGTVVAYEADCLDQTDHSGWTVIVIGIARLEGDVEAIPRCLARISPWLSGANAEILTISAEMVTGYRLVPVGPGAGLPGGAASLKGTRVCTGQGHKALSACAVAGACSCG